MRSIILPLSVHAADRLVIDKSAVNSVLSADCNGATSAVRTWTQKAKTEVYGCVQDATAQVACIPSGATCVQSNTENSVINAINGLTRAEAATAAASLFDFTQASVDLLVDTLKSTDCKSENIASTCEKRVLFGYDKKEGETAPAGADWCITAKCGADNRVDVINSAALLAYTESIKGATKKWTQKPGGDAADVEILYGSQAEKDAINDLNDKTIAEAITAMTGIKIDGAENQLVDLLRNPACANCTKDPTAATGNAAFATASAALALVAMPLMF